MSLIEVHGLVRATKPTPLCGVAYFKHMDDSS